MSWNEEEVGEKYDSSILVNVILTLLNANPIPVTLYAVPLSTAHVPLVLLHTLPIVNSTGITISNLVNPALKLLYRDIKLVTVMVTLDTSPNAILSSLLTDADVMVDYV